MVSQKQKNKRYYYCWQSFLMNADTESIKLDDYQTQQKELFLNYTEDKNLFDIDVCCRSISLSELDSTIDTEEDFIELIKKLNGVNCLYIEYDRTVSDCPVVLSHSENTIKQYLYYFNKYHIDCRINNMKGER